MGNLPTLRTGLWLVFASAACGESDASAKLGGDEAFGTGGAVTGVDSSSPDGGGEGGGTSDPPPETEDEADFRVPRASGRFVYAASENTDSVAVIDSQDLAIDVVAVGRGPTVVLPLPASATVAGRVVVLDQGSDDIALLHTSDAFATTASVFRVTPGANNLESTPDGAYVFVYHDVDGPEALGPGSDQELTVFEVDTEQTYAMTIGAHPRSIAFSSDSRLAYVVTDDGVNVIPVADLALIGKPDIFPVVRDAAIDPARVEIHVAADQAVALSRVEGEREVVVTDFADGQQMLFTIPDVPTDLDLAPDGSSAIFTTPSLAGSHFYELALPVEPDTRLERYDLPREYVGLTQISPTGDALILYTTVNPLFDALQRDTDRRVGSVPVAGGGGSSGPETTGSTGTESSSGGESSSTGDSEDTATDSGESGVPTDQDPRRRVTVLHRDAGAWSDPSTLFVDEPVTSVGIAPDGANALLLHEATAASTGPGWSYTLVDLTKTFPVKKHHTIETEPGPVLFTPEGDRAVMLLRDDSQGVRRIDAIDLRSFIVNSLGLGSPPDGAGYVENTHKIFVSQDHPSGRITFIDLNGHIETITGFRLNEAIKD